MICQLQEYSPITWISPLTQWKPSLLIYNIIFTFFYVDGNIILTRKITYAILKLIWLYIIYNIWIDDLEIISNFLDYLPTQNHMISFPIKSSMIKPSLISIQLKFHIYNHYNLNYPTNLLNQNLFVCWGRTKLDACEIRIDAKMSKR